jgi:site-specific DNA-methyltransferase (adenine-specific)
MSAVRHERLADRVELILGDCLDVMPTLDPADHVLCDPPYEDEIHASRARFQRTDGHRKPKKLGFEGINAIRGEVSKQLVRASSGWALVFSLAEGIRAWRDDLQAAGAKWDQTLFWIKPDAMPKMNGQGAARGAECIAAVWCGRGYRKWNGRGKRGVYEYPVKSPSRDGRHPAEKPLALMAALVRDYTNAGQMVLDPFMGSGTTGVACIKSGRRFIGIERDPKHFEVACDRIQRALDEPSMFVEQVKAKQIGLPLEPAVQRPKVPP